MRVIAYHTRDDLYVEAATAFRESCRKYNLKFYIEPIDDLGSWMKNTYYKPKFIKKMRKKFPNERLVYVDVDAKFVRKPTLLEENFMKEYDICLRKRGHEMLSGTLIINDSHQIDQLLDLWIKACDNYEANNNDPIEQKLLQGVVEANPHFFVGMLPPEYCKIYDRDSHGSPVIEHYQASRTKRMAEIANPEAKLPVRVRKNRDGSFWLPRKNKQTERYMDDNYIRVGSELLWVPANANASLAKFKDYHKGSPMYVVGKGPSLDGISELPHPALCVNESIHKIERGRRYCVYQDIRIAEECCPKDPDIPLFTNTKARNTNLLHFEKYIYDPRVWSLGFSTITAAIAIKIAEHMGASEILMVGFDACMGGSLEYADCIGKDMRDGGDAGRFLRHRPLLESMSKKVKFTSFENQS